MEPLWGLAGFRRSEPFWSLRTAQNRSERAQSRSEPLRIAQSAPRAAQSRSDSARAVAQSGRSELLEKVIGELGVTCTLHIRSAVMLDVVLSSPCMYMHGFALVYIYIYIEYCSENEFLGRTKEV